MDQQSSSTKVCGHLKVAGFVAVWTAAAKKKAGACWPASASPARGASPPPSSCLQDRGARKEVGQEGRHHPCQGGFPGREDPCGPSSHSAGGPQGQ